MKRRALLCVIVILYPNYAYAIQGKKPVFIYDYQGIAFFKGADTEIYIFVTENYQEFR